MSQIVQTDSITLINPESFRLLGSWIYKYNLKISNIRLRIKYYILILKTIEDEINEMNNDHIKLNDSLRIINIKNNIDKPSFLSYKKLINNKQNILQSIQELEKDEQYVINEIFN